jgi:SAM-dependent methyltransferase
MLDILRALPQSARVLDLGCARGSFPDDASSATVIRLDQEFPVRLGGRAHFVRGDAARLPFANATFDAVISNHSLEHFSELEAALREIGRVVRPEGVLFIAVPDASTLTDKVYRWVGRGGGHVNAFVSSEDTAQLIERITGFDHIATKPLYSSLAFLNRRNFQARAPRRLWLLGGGSPALLFLYVWLSRRLDRWCGTRTGHYGWAFYFGKTAAGIDTRAWVNVCIRCGSGASADFLRAYGSVRSRLPALRVYRCSQCGTANPFAQDPD